MVRAGDANQFYTSLLAHTRPACGQNLLHFIITHLISVKLLDAVGMHAGGIKRGHIRLMNFVAACQQKQRSG
jgi:hypothetical protein